MLLLLCLPLTLAYEPTLHHISSLNAVEVESSFTPVLDHIPQFLPHTNRYEGEPTSYGNEYDKIRDQVLQSLEKSETPDAWRTLADYHLFGTHYAPINYTKAVEYYHRVVKSTPDPHAYYMLGFAYASGLFGAIERDEGRAHMYYHFAAVNGHLSANMVLGHRYHNSELQNNCESALPYYQRVAEIVKHERDSEQQRFEKEFPKRIFYDVYEKKFTYDIPISDFTGGLYGEHSEEYSEISEKKQKEDYTRLLNAQFSDYENLMIEASRAYNSYYGKDRNRTEAARLLQKCVDLAKKEYLDKNITPKKTDKTMISNCFGMLGHMYINGDSVPENIPLGIELLQQSALLVQQSSLYDMAQLVEKGVVSLQAFQNLNLNSSTLETASNLPNPPNTDEYKIAVLYGLSQRQAGIFAYLKRIEDLGLVTHDNAPDVYKLLNKLLSWRKPYAPISYHASQYLQNGSVPEYSCSKDLSLVESYCRSNVNIVAPELKLAYEAVSRKEYSKALVYYAIASEMGFESASISAAHLLFQLQPLWQAEWWDKLRGKTPIKRKTFTKERIEAAVMYLSRVSAQNIDAMNLLGTIIDTMNVSSPLLSSAATYYQRAVSKSSLRGSYKLAQLYEYGKNSTPDFYLAKRYYDLGRAPQSATLDFPISLALLRLRIKQLFWETGNQMPITKENDHQQEYQKPIAIENDHQQVIDSQAQDIDHDSYDRAAERASAHHEGRDYDDDEPMSLYSLLVTLLVVGIPLFRRLRLGNGRPAVMAFFVVVALFQLWQVYNGEGIGQFQVFIL